MPPGLAEQSPIYKHKVSDTLCPGRDSPKFVAIETKTDLPDCFPARGNLELLDVDLVVGRGRDASSPLLHLATHFCDEGVAATWTWSQPSFFERIEVPHKAKCAARPGVSINPRITRTNANA